MEDLLLSSRVTGLSESITLKLNEKATKLTEEGKQIFNLTAGQLPFKPPASFIERIGAELNFLKSYQYSPVPGLRPLIDKFVEHAGKQRGVDFKDQEIEFDGFISNGAKHSIYTALGAIVDPGDEVVLLAPYWVSYPPMIKFWGGSPIVLKCHNYDAFTPVVEDLEKLITPKTKAIILNSPNNPTGIHYSKEWMEKFAEIMKAHPHVYIISDEIYSLLYYFDPGPTYFYQHSPELLKRTIITDGISKYLASTGLRIGLTIAPKKITQAMSKIQGQTTSGANSLIQKAVLSYPFEDISQYLGPIKAHLRTNADILREKFRANGLAKAWYQSTSAFYFMINFTAAPRFQKYGGDFEVDKAFEISNDLLENYGVATVPGSDFGMPNTARMSLVLEEAPFKEACDRLVAFMLES